MNRKIVNMLSKLAIVTMIMNGVLSTSLSLSRTVYAETNTTAKRTDSSLKNQVDLNKNESPAKTTTDSTVPDAVQPTSSSSEKESETPADSDVMTEKNEANAFKLNKSAAAKVAIGDQQTTGGLHVSNMDFFWDGHALVAPTKENPANVRYTLTLDEANRQTGTTPFNEDNEAGHDNDASNAIIRTNDTLDYQVKISIARIDGGTEQITNLPTLYAVPIFQDDIRVGSKNYQPTGTFRNSTYSNSKGTVTFAKSDGEKVSGSISTIRGTDYTTTTSTGTAVTRDVKLKVGVLPNDFSFSVGIVLAAKADNLAADSSIYGLANDLEPIAVSQKSSASLSGVSASNFTNTDSWTKDDKIGPKNVKYSYRVYFGPQSSLGGGSLGFKINNMEVDHTGTYAFENQKTQEIPMDPKSNAERYKGYVPSDSKSGNVTIQYASDDLGNDPVGSPVNFTTSNDDWLKKSTWVPTDSANVVINQSAIFAQITYVFNDLDPYNIGGELNPENLRATTTRSLTLSQITAKDFFDDPVVVEKQPTVTTSWTSNTPGIIDGALQLTKDDSNTMTWDKNTDEYGRNVLAYSSSSQLARVGFLYAPENYKEGMEVSDGVLKDTVLWGAYNNKSYSLNERDTTHNFYTKDADGKVTGEAKGIYEYGVPKDPQQKITDEFLHKATQDDFIWKYKGDPAGANGDNRVAAFRVTLPETVYVQFKKYNGEINRWGASPHIQPLKPTPKFIGNSDKEGVTNLVVAHAITAFNGGESKDYLRPDLSTPKQYTSFNAVKNKNPDTWLSSNKQTPSNYWIDWLAYGVTALNVTVGTNAEKPSVTLGDSDKFNYSMKLSTDYLEGFKSLSKEDMKNQLAKTKITISSYSKTDDKQDNYTYIGSDGEKHQMSVSVGPSNTTINFDDPKNEDLLNYLTDSMYQSFVTGDAGTVTLNFSGGEFVTTRAENTSYINSTINFFGNWDHDNAWSRVTATTPNGLGVLEKIAPKTVGKLSSNYQIQVFPYTFNGGSENNLRGIVPLPVSKQDGSDFAGASTLTNITNVNSNGKTVTFYYSQKQNLDVNPSEPIQEGNDQGWIKWDGKSDSLKKAKSIAYQITGPTNNEMLQFNLDFQTSGNQYWDRYRQRSYVNSDSKYHELVPSNYVQYVVFEHGNVELSKVDAKTKAPLDGAEFVITSSKSRLSNIQKRLAQYQKEIVTSPEKATDLKAALLKDLVPHLVRGDLAKLFPELNNEVVNSDNLYRMWRYLSSDTRLQSPNKLDFNQDGVVNEADKALFIDGAIAPYVVTTAQGRATFDNLEVGDGGGSKDYWIFEINAPSKYVNTSEPTHVLVDKDGTAKIEVNNSKYSFDVEKEWKDVPAGIQTPEITVDLYANDQKTDKSIQLNKENGYHGSFSDLDVRDSSGNLIHYTVKEQTPSQYKADDQQGEIIDGIAKLTNTYITEKITINGQKKWDDQNNQDNKRPAEITVNLLADGKIISSKKVTNEDNWTYEFTNLDKYKAGKPIDYTVTENQVDGYTGTVTGTTITNKYTPELTTIKGTKTWHDKDDQDGIRPKSITVHLMNGNKEVESQVVTADKNGEWKYAFDKLPVYENGKQISYTVKEDSVKGYSETNSGYNITNTHSPELTKVEGTKTWKDNEDNYSTRPDQIKVTLMADGKEMMAKVVTAKDNWKYSFNDLAKFKDGGKKIKYTISETPVNGYQSKINDGDLTNTLLTTNVEGKKIWDDKNNKAKVRPESIDVALLQNGKQIDSIVVKSEDEWKYHFVNLPKVDKAGKEYVYSVKELNIPKFYTTSVQGYTIKNTYKPTVPPKTSKPPKGPKSKNHPPEKLKKQHQSYPKTGSVDNHWLVILGGIIVVLLVFQNAMSRRRKKN